MRKRSLEVKLGKALSFHAQLSASGLGDHLGEKVQLPVLMPGIYSASKTLPEPILEVTDHHEFA